MIRKSTRVTKKVANAGISLEIRSKQRDGRVTAPCYDLDHSLSCILRKRVAQWRFGDGGEGKQK